MALHHPNLIQSIIRNSDKAISKLEDSIVYLENSLDNIYVLYPSDDLVDELYNSML